MPVTLSQALPTGFPSVTVQYDTSNGTASAPADYTAVVAGTVTFTAGGAATVNASVPVMGNITVGASKTFTVTLSNAVRAVLGTSSAIGTITDDDVVEAPAEAPQPYIEAPPSSTAPAGAPFSLPLRAGDATPPFRWSVIGGTLPAGLSLDATTGVISGTPMLTGTSSVTVRVVDAKGTNADLVVRIAVNGSAVPPIIPPPVIPPVVLPPAPTPPGTFAATPVFNDSGVASAVFAGGTSAQIEAAVLVAGGRGAWVQDARGVFQLLIAGGPASLRASFSAAFPGGLAGPVAVFVIR